MVYYANRDQNPDYVSLTKDIALNLTDRSLQGPDGKAPLRLAEFLILKTLHENKGKIFTRQQLLAASSEARQDHMKQVIEKNIEVHIARIRTKLRNVGAPDNLIQTAWGQGYSYAPPSDTNPPKPRPH